jgi:Na+/serine symporter
MSVAVENSTTATTKLTAAMCLGHFAALVRRAIETLGLGILIVVAVSVRHAHLNTAAVVGNVVTKQGSQSVSKYFQLVCYDTGTLSPE